MTKFNIAGYLTFCVLNYCVKAVEDFPLQDIVVHKVSSAVFLFLIYSLCHWQLLQICCIFLSKQLSIQGIRNRILVILEIERTLFSLYYSVFLIYFCLSLGLCMIRRIMPWMILILYFLKSPHVTNVYIFHFISFHNIFKN